MPFIVVSQSIPVGVVTPLIHFAVEDGNVSVATGQLRTTCTCIWYM